MKLTNAPVSVSKFRGGGARKMHHPVCDLVKEPIYNKKNTNRFTKYEIFKIARIKYPWRLDYLPIIFIMITNTV